MTVHEAIRRRFSVRHYEPRPVPEKILKAIEKASETSVPLDKNISVRLHLIRQSRLVAERMTYLAGRQWLFGSSPHFIIATAEEKPGFMLETGFRMEQVILLATAQGLGTCWVGGLFIEEQIADFLKLPPGERVIAITPLGYPDTSFYGRAINPVIHLGVPEPRRRKPLEQIVYGAEFGSPLESKDPELLEILECTRLAPSWTNSQPWRFLVDERQIVALAEIRTSRFYHGKHYYRLDLGIAMSHFFLAAKELGWKGNWQVTGFEPAELAQKHAIPAGYEVLGIYSR